MQRAANAETESEADGLRRLGEAVLQCARDIDPTAKLRAFSRTEAGSVSLRIGTDSGHVDAVRAAVAKTLELSPVSVAHDLLQSGSEVVVVLDRRLEWQAACARAAESKCSVFLWLASVAVAVLAVLVQLLASAHVRVFARAVANATNVTNLTETLDQAIDAAQQTVELVCDAMNGAC